jgi:hypothetical protein
MLGDSEISRLEFLRRNKTVAFLAIFFIVVDVRMLFDLASYLLPASIIEKGKFTHVNILEFYNIFTIFAVIGPITMFIKGFSHLREYFEHNRRHLEIVKKYNFDKISHRDRIEIIDNLPKEQKDYVEKYFYQSKEDYASVYNKTQNVIAGELAAFVCLGIAFLISATIMKGHGDYMKYLVGPIDSRLYLFVTIEVAYLSMVYTGDAFFLRYERTFDMLPSGADGKDGGDIPRGPVHNALEKVEGSFNELKQIVGHKK